MQLKKILRSALLKITIIKNIIRGLKEKDQLPLTSSEISKIMEHRKSIKIYDIFIFFNELELLEMRLNILSPYVDYFVIVEATKTFTGKTKKLYYQENKEYFKKWEHKIIHYITKDTPDSDTDKKCDQNILKLANESPHVPKGQTQWLREFYQKEMMQKPLLDKAKDADWCFVSDIDEIWNPEKTINLLMDVVFKYKQKVYTYYLDNRSNEPWSGTFATTYKNIKNNSLVSLDTMSSTNYTYVKDGGWHFTNQGGVEFVKKKLESYGHQEFNTDDVKSNIEKRIIHNEDFIGRKFKFWTDESELPKYILENKEKYKHLFKPNE